MNKQTETLQRLKRLIENNPKNDSNTNYELCNGLSEVCIMLSKSEESTEEQKKEFLKFSEMFKKFANFHKSQLDIKEVNMRKQKTKTQTLAEEKKKRDAKKTEEEMKVKEVISEIRNLEKKFPQEVVERACYRYKSSNTERRTAEREVKEAEVKLQQAKAKIK